MNSHENEERNLGEKEKGSEHPPRPSVATGPKERGQSTKHKGRQDEDQKTAALHTNASLIPDP